MYSYDHDASWVECYTELRNDRHPIKGMSSWDEGPIESTYWGVAFVDHAPGSRRIVDIERLAKQAEVAVVNDTDVSRWSIMSNKLISRRPQALKTSVLVPCAGKHVARLPELIGALRAQTRQADEVIVAASGCAASDLGGIDAKILHNTEPLSAGANRNRATAAAVGDVLIYQDADDLPHCQRVEIVAGLFEQHVIDHLMHFFFYMQDERVTFSVDEASASSRYRSSLMRPVTYRTGLVEYVTNGNVAIVRSIAQGVQWPEYRGIGEDQEFNRAVYARTKRTVVTPLPLITYRHNFSTFS